MLRLGIALLLSLAPRAAFAWDVQEGRIPQRLAELERSWLHKSPKELLADKLKRALQPHKPDWVNKTSWYVTLGDKLYNFGVGLTEEMRYRDLQLAITENRALALVPGRGAQVSVLDWYWDKDDDTLYALAVELPQ